MSAPPYVAQRSVGAAAAPRVRQRRMSRSDGVAVSGPPQRCGRGSGLCGQLLEAICRVAGCSRERVSGSKAAARGRGVCHGYAIYDTQIALVGNSLQTMRSVSVCNLTVPVEHCC